MSKKCMNKLCEHYSRGACKLLEGLNFVRCKQNCLDDDLINL